MKAYFSVNHNPDAKDLKQLSQKTGLSKRVLQVKEELQQCSERVLQVQKGIAAVQQKRTAGAKRNRSSAANAYCRCKKELQQCSKRVLQVQKGIAASFSIFAFQE